MQISSEAWQARLRAVIQRGSRYCNPRFDAIWCILTFIVAFVAPIVIYFALLSVLPREAEVDFDFPPYGWDEDSRYWKARLISFGAFVGMLLLLILPMMLWKLAGKRSINKMLQKFEAEDRAVRGSFNGQVPIYRIKTPGVGSHALHLTITLPEGSRRTSFQTGVPLPTYLVNPPADAVPGYYPSGPRLDGVPLYNNFDEKVPSYDGPRGYLDEKNEFADLNV